MKTPIADARLPQLEHAVDAGTMAGVFQELFRRDYPDRALRVRDCEVRRVYHKPGRSCTITYRVRTGDADDGTRDQWFWATLDSRGRRRRHAEPASWSGCGFWKPVSWWEPMGLTVHAFPYDPRLPKLGPLLDPESVRREVETRLSDWLPGRWRCGDVDIRLVKYMPGSRCVMRYDLALEGPSGRRDLAVYGKTYRTSRSRYVYEALRALTDRLAPGDRELVVPRPLAHLDAVNTVWQEAWDAERLSDLGARVGWPRVLAGPVPDRIGRLLARVHETALPEGCLRPGPSPEAVLHNAAGDAADVVDFLPARRAELERTLAEWSARAPGGSDAPRATLHGTFKLAQLLCRPDAAAVVDFDAIASGDPLYDVAEFVASALFLEVTHAVSRESIRTGVESFLAAYAQRVPWDCPRSRVAWYVVAFLLGKIHSSLKKHESADERERASAFALLDEWLALAIGP